MSPLEEGLGYNASTLVCWVSCLTISSPAEDSERLRCLKRCSSRNKTLITSTLFMLPFYTLESQDSCAEGSRNQRGEPERQQVPIENGCLRRVRVIGFLYFYFAAKFRILVANTYSSTSSLNPHTASHYHCTFMVFKSCTRNVHCLSS